MLTSILFSKHILCLYDYYCKDVTESTVKRPQISFGLKLNSQEIALKHYLVSKNGASEKDLVMRALLAFYLPAALTQTDRIKQTDLTKSAIDSCWSLLDCLCEIYRSLDNRDPATKAVVRSFVKSMMPVLYKEFEFGGDDLVLPMVSGQMSVDRVNDDRVDNDRVDDDDDDDDEYEYEPLPLSSNPIGLSPTLLAQLEK
jgi:hypothetical protein